MTCDSYDLKTPNPTLPNSLPTYDTLRSNMYMLALGLVHGGHAEPHRRHLAGGRARRRSDDFSSMSTP